MKGLKDLSKPYKVPAIVANIATNIQVTETTLSGISPVKVVSVTWIVVAILATIAGT